MLRKSSFGTSTSGCRLEATCRAIPGWINALVFAPTDDRLVSSSSQANTIKFWNPLAREDVAQITRPRTANLATPAVLAPRGSLLAYTQSNSVVLVLGPLRTITLVDVP